MADTNVPWYLMNPAAVPPEQAAPQAPSALQQYLPQADGLQAAQAQSKVAQEAELAGLNDYINQIAQKPQGINWTPLASYIDSVTPGSKLAPAAQAMAPMSQEQKDKMLFDLKSKLLQGRAQLSRENLDSIKAQTQMQQYREHQDELERHNRAMEGTAFQRADQMGGRVEAMKTQQAFQAAKYIHDDSVLKQMRQQAVNIDKGMDLLAGSPSNKMLAEVAQDFSAALSGKAASSDFKLKELMTPSAQQQIADMKAYLTANPDQPAPPEVVKFWKDMGNRLNEAYNRQMHARGQGKLKGLEAAFRNNPAAYSAAAEAASLYDHGEWRVLEGMEQPAESSAGPHGPTVVQGGHTYNWNPSTGKYE